MEEVNVVSHNFELQDIKQENISSSELDLIHQQTKSYEAIFNKRAQKYKLLGLKELIKSDSDYRNYILKEYTFLKRPVFLIDDIFYIGNSKKVVEGIKEALKDE
jgi:arsenate reductase (glutaredoxin)